MIALTVAAALSGAAVQQSEDQWIHRETSSGPVASFLAWNYRSVLARASCEGGVLLIEYFPGSGRVEDDPPMALWLDDGSLEMRTTIAGDGQGTALQGRIEVTPQLISAMQRAGHMMLEVNEPAADLDEPWHLGTAEPLQRVARHCAGF